MTRAILRGGGTVEAAQCSRYTSGARCLVWDPLHHLLAVWWEVIYSTSLLQCLQIYMVRDNSSFPSSRKTGNRCLPHQWEVFSSPFPWAHTLKIHKQNMLGELLALSEVKETVAYLIIIYGNHTHIPSARLLLRTSAKRCTHWIYHYQNKHRSSHPVPSP